MGRWLEKVLKLPEDVPTKLAEPGFVGFDSTPLGHFQENIPTEMAAANENTVASPLSAWLHLLALADGHVIQRAGDLSTASVVEHARGQWGDNLLTVVPVFGFERPLSEQEIVKALAGALGAPSPPHAPLGDWLARIAHCLGVRPNELLEEGHLEQHDLIELADTNPELVAEAIQQSPAWINRPLHRP